MDEIHEACGIFGVCAPGEDVATLTYFGSLSLQHRGQESAGIATSNGRGIHVEKQAGRVDRFTESQMEILRGDSTCPSYLAVGHNRYSNTGSNILPNFQPYLVATNHGLLSLAHNGNLTNPQDIARILRDAGIRPRGSSDSELIALLISYESLHSVDIEEAIKRALSRLTGAYSLVLMTEDRLYGIRDPWGIRPLSIGRLNGKHQYLLASETCAFAAIGAKSCRDVGPGEMAIIEPDREPEIMQIQPRIGDFLCIFEFIYFASPGSEMCDRLLQTVRRHMGEQLWKEHPVDIVDPHEWIVIGVPDTGLPAAKGYADASEIELRDGLVKNRYVGRTFINPSQSLRRLGVRAKLQALPREVSGKKVVMLEDSIVRGTTTGEVVQMVLDAGALEVHLRITSPPYIHSCYMGVDTQNESELIASRMSVPEICEHIHATSLGYLSLEGVIRAIDIPEHNCCAACFSGKYPFPVCRSQDRSVLEQQ